MGWNETSTEIIPQDGNFVRHDWLPGVAWQEPFTWQKIARPERYVEQEDGEPWEGELPCLTCKLFNAFSKVIYDKLAFLLKLG